MQGNLVIDNGDKTANLVIGVPCLNFVMTRFFKAFWAFAQQVPNNVAMRPSFTEMKPISDYIDPLKGNVITDGARSMLVRAAQKAEAKWLFFLDDDTIPPKGTLARMLNTAKQNDIKILTGMVWGKTEPSEPMVFKEWGAGCWSDWYDKPAQVVKIDSAGLACTLIAVDVFDAIPEPWFLGQTTWMPDQKGIKAQSGEDTVFYKACKDAGIQAYADSGVVCLHQSRTNGKLYPPIHVIERITNANKRADEAEQTLIASIHPPGSDNAD